MNRFLLPVFFILLTLWSLTFFSSHADESLIYPIQQMSKLECRFQDFSSLSSDCKMPLPILHTIDYTKYKNDYSLYRRVYTILWGSSYDYGWDVGNGGHSGVDIATSKGTPVYAIAGGKVVTATWLSGWGNVVKIQHSINGRSVYSVYAHLSAITVARGDSVKGNDKVGEVGSTGNSTGNHLHFQIDLASSGAGPRYRSNCRIKNYDEIVNSNVCFPQLNTNTIDPLLFLESNGAVVKTTQIQKPQIQTISQTGLLSIKEIQKKEIQEFLSKYKVSVKILNFGGNIELGKKGTFRVSVLEKRNNKPFTGSFPGNMNFKYDSGKMMLFPTGILQIDNGVRDFEITPKTSGMMSFDVNIGEIPLSSFKFGVFDSQKNYTPKNTALMVDSAVYMSEAGKGILYFQDSSKLNLLGVSFTGTYTLTSTDGKTSFCLKTVPQILDLAKVYASSCNEKDYTPILSFTYKDTFSGVFVFGFKVNNEGNNDLILQNPSGKVLVVRNILGRIPKDLTTSNAYYDDMKTMLSLKIPTGLKVGYIMPDRELTREDAVDMISNALKYQRSQCDDEICVAGIDARMRNLLVENADRYTPLTRLEMVYLLNRYITLSTFTQTPIKFRDVKGDDILKVQSVLSDQTWKDNFGKTLYFQPDKKITRAEGMYLIRLALGK